MKPNFRCLAVICVLAAMFVSATGGAAMTGQTPNPARLADWPVTSMPTDGAVQSGSAPMTAQSAAWKISCVDCAKDFTAPSDRALRLDAAGHPHIAYGGDHLYYAWYDGAAWHFETADSAAPVGGHAALALDDDGNPHISYAGVGGIRYAHRSSDGVWTTQLAAADDQYSELVPSAIGLDASGRPCIAYGQNFYMSHGELRYTCQDGGAWETPQVIYQSRILSVDQVSLAFDSQGRPHVAYYNNYRFDPQLKYAYYAGPGAGNCWPEYNWNCQDVDAEFAGGQHPSLALDSQDRPHITYDGSRYSNVWLKYAHWNGTSWEMEWIGNDGRTSGSSLALDSADHPHIAYTHSEDPYSNDAGLRLASWTGSQWQVQQVNDRGGVAFLALDAAGNAHIAYLNADGMWYAAWNGSAWNDQLLDPGYPGLRWYGLYNSLALDASGQAHIAYRDDVPPFFKYARGSDDGWEFQRPVTDTNTSAGGFPSLALDAAGQPHIAYNGHSTDCHASPFLGYASWTGGVWTNEIVDANIGSPGCGDGQVGPTALALDSAGRPHITYALLARAGYSLRYATWTGTAWITQTIAIDTAGAHGMALDSSEQPHVVYAPFDDGGCYYASLQDSIWITQTLVPNVWGQRIRAVALALDAADRPHVAYYYTVSHGVYDPETYLVYAVRDGSAWITTTLETGPIGSDLHIVLDASGHPRISYVGAAGLKLASWTGSAWDIQIVYPSNTIWYNSLALDAHGLAHITYRDKNDGDLRIADQMLPPLTLVKRAEPVDNLRVGDVVTFTLELGSAGLAAALRDPLPAGLSYVSGSLTGTVSPLPIYVGEIPTGSVSFAPPYSGGAIFWQGAILSGVQVITFEAILNAPVLVNTAWLTDTVNARRVSASVVLNPKRVYLPLALRNK